MGYETDAGVKFGYPGERNGQIVLELTATGSVCTKWDRIPPSGFLWKDPGRSPGRKRLLPTSVDPLLSTRCICCEEQREGVYTCTLYTLYSKDRTKNIAALTAALRFDFIETFRILLTGASPERVLHAGVAGWRPAIDAYTPGELE